MAVRHALKAEALGVDAISIDGFECAGHPGDDDIPGLVLIPAAARAGSDPVIASGGFATGGGLVAALALGAYAVNMGTRFVATTEAPVHQNVKDQIVANDERATHWSSASSTTPPAWPATRSRRKSPPLRTTRRDLRRRGAPRLRSTRTDRVLTHGDMHGGMWWAGQAQGLIDSVQSCQDIVDGIIDEADRIITGLGPAFSAAGSYRIPGGLTWTSRQSGTTSTMAS